MYLADRGYGGGTLPWDADGSASTSNRPAAQPPRAAENPNFADLQFRHLRHRAMTAWANAGVDSVGIAAISGHQISTIAPKEWILQTYIAKIREQAISALRTSNARPKRQGDVPD